MYDKVNDIKCEECPSIMKSINKLNATLDKYTNKFSKNLVERVINTCKRIKFTPFEESAINQFVCLTNNLYTNFLYSRHNNNIDIPMTEQDITIGLSGFSKYFNVKDRYENISETATAFINNYFNDIYVTNTSLMYKSAPSIPLNSLLFINNTKTSNFINTVNELLNSEINSSNDIEFYDSYNDVFDNFVSYISTMGRSKIFEKY